MLRWLFRLGLEIELAVEADRLGVVDRHVHEAGQVVDLTLHLGVPQVLVTFATAPEGVAVAAQVLGHVERLFHLGRGEGKRVGIGAGGRAMHVARIAEQVGRSPEQLDAGSLLLTLQGLHHRIEIAIGLGERFAFGRDVAIVEAIEMDTELLEELERHLRPVHGVLDRILTRLPRPLHRARSERIAAGAAEGVPIGNGEAKMVLHRSAFDHFVLIVMAKGERIFGLRTLEADFLDIRKRGHVRFLWAGLFGRLIVRIILANHWARRKNPR